MLVAVKPARNTKPQVLITACMMMPLMTMTKCCSASGRPRWHSRRITLLSGCQSGFSTDAAGIFRSAMTQYANANSCASSVAAAAPGMPQPKRITNSRSSTMFRHPAVNMAISGLFPSPSARRIAAAMLYAIVMSVPAYIMVK